jgi:hypothetical protein
MILYHGSNITITEINLNLCKPFKDFGQGFYLTTIKSQAEKMANRTSRIYGGDPVISVFDFEDSSTPELSILTFANPSEEWAKFVINNRSRNFIDDSAMDCNRDNKYDIVTGPVANDDLALLFRQFENGLIDIDILRREMEYKQLTNQYSFHTIKATSLLTHKEDADE